MEAVLVTTEFRGVFFGYIEDDKKAPGELTLKDARNCIYWSSDCKGFLGLASFGPTESCKIGNKVKTLKLYKITSISLVENSAVKKWEQHD